MGVKLGVTRLSVGVVNKMMVGLLLAKVQSVGYSHPRDHIY